MKVLGAWLSLPTLLSEVNVRTIQIMATVVDLEAKVHSLAQAVTAYVQARDAIDAVLRQKIADLTAAGTVDPVALDAAMAEADTAIGALVPPAP